MPRSLTAISLLVSLAILVLAAPAAARAPMALGLSNPAKPTLAALDASIAETGTRPALWSLWSDWGSRGGHLNCRPDAGTCYFPTDAALELHSRGIDPVIWWQPTDPAKGYYSGAYSRYQRILRGQHDAYITEWARAAKLEGDQAKAAGNPHPVIILRFAHEAVGQWFPWAIGRYDNTKKNYKQAWRYIYKKFKAVGATQYVRFMWSHVYPYKWAYPGDSYVDYVGLTILNFGADRKWKWMESMVRSRVKQARKFTGKPIVLAEVASHYLGGSKATWLRRGYWRTFKLRKVKAIIYLDTNVPQLTKKHPDWRLVKPDNGSALEMYRKIAANPKFQGRLW